MPEQDVREELEILGNPLLSHRRDPSPAKDWFSTQHFIMTVARRPLVSKLCSWTSICGLRVTVETHQVPKGPIQCKYRQHVGRRKRGLWWPTHFERKVHCCKGIKRCANCNSNHTANYRVCSKWKEFRATNSERALLPVQRPRGLNATPQRSLRPQSLPSSLRSIRKCPDGAMSLKVVE